MKKIRTAIHKEVINLLATQIDDYYDPNSLRIDLDSVGNTAWSNEYLDYDIYYAQEHYLILLGQRIGKIEMWIQNEKLKQTRRRM